jgi:hypothetical protein
MTVANNSWRYRDVFDFTFFFYCSINLKKPAFKA